MRQWVGLLVVLGQLARANAATVLPDDETPPYVVEAAREAHRLLHAADSLARDGHVADAEKSYQQALSIARGSPLPAQHAVEVLVGLGLLYEGSARVEQSAAAYEEALHIVQSQGNDEAETQLLNRLARLYATSGRHAQAEPLLWKLIGILENSSEPKPVEIAGHVHNLGEVYRMLNRLPEAETMHRRALAARRITGAESAETVESLESLGVVLAASGKVHEAERTLLEALDVSERAFGVAHVATGAVLQDLIAFYRSQRRPENADPLQARVDSIAREEVLGGP